MRGRFLEIPVFLGVVFLCHTLYNYHAVSKDQAKRANKQESRNTATKSLFFNLMISPTTTVFQRASTSTPLRSTDDFRLFTLLSL